MMLHGLRCTFRDDESFSGDWIFQRDSDSLVPRLMPCSADDPSPVLYVDNRHGHRWGLLGKREIELVPGGQYSLSARIGQWTWYGTSTIQVRDCSRPDSAEPLARLAFSSETEGQLKEVSLVFRAPKEATTVRLEVSSRGKVETFLSAVALEENRPPRSTFETGVELKQPLIRDASLRVGRTFEIEDVVDERLFTREDADNDGLWSLCEFSCGGNPRDFLSVNPFLFSENGVLKSDSKSREEGGCLPALEIKIDCLAPGQYNVFLSDPFRDAAISFDGKSWQRIPGGRGEIDLGVVVVADEFRLWIDHRFVTADNPGPIYADYLRFMPVYVADSGLEEPASFPQADRVPATQEGALHVRSLSLAERKSEWVIAGIPFARGTFFAGDGFQIDGVADAYARPLVYWPDGSIKWLRAGFKTGYSPAGRNAYTIRYGKDVQGIPDAKTPFSRNGAHYCLEAGDIRVTIGKGIWETISFKGRTFIRGRPRVKCETESGVRLNELVAESVSVENEGPNPRIVIKGHLFEKWQAGPIGFTAILWQAANSTLGLSFTVVNESSEEFQTDRGCGPALGLTPLDLVIPGINVAAEEIEWPCGVLEPGARQQLTQSGKGADVADFVGRWELVEEGDARSSGEVVDGWVDIKGRGMGLAVGVREFVEKYPSSIAVTREGGAYTVELGMCPGSRDKPFRYAQGTWITTDVAFVFHEAITPAERTAALEAVTRPLRVMLPVEGYCQTGVFGEYAPRKSSALSACEESVESALRYLYQHGSAYGMEDWGGIFGTGEYYVRGTLRMWTNMEGDMVEAMLSQFLRTGDLEHYERAEQAARHFAGADITHFSTREGWTGGAHPHTGSMIPGHQVDPPNFAHAHGARELLWFYYMTGNELLKEAACGLADYILANMPPQGVYSQVRLSRWGKGHPPFGMYDQPRECGLPLQCLCAVYEFTRDDRYMQTTHRIADYALRSQETRLGCWLVISYERPVYHTGGGTFDCTLYRGLLNYWRLTRDKRVERAFALLGNWLQGKFEPNPTASRILVAGRPQLEGYLYAARFSAPPRRKAVLDLGARKLEEAAEWIRGKVEPKGIAPMVIIGINKLLSVLERE